MPLKEASLIFLPLTVVISEKVTHVAEKAMAPHSSTLAWKIPWTEEPGRLQSMGSPRVGQDWATSLSLSWRLINNRWFWRLKTKCDWGHGQGRVMWTSQGERGRGSVVLKQHWPHSQGSTLTMKCLPWTPLPNTITWASRANAWIWGRHEHNRSWSEHPWAVLLSYCFFYLFT